MVGFRFLLEPVLVFFFTCLTLVLACFFGFLELVLVCFLDCLELGLGPHKPRLTRDLSDVHTVSLSSSVGETELTVVVTFFFGRLNFLEGLLLFLGSFVVVFREIPGSEKSELIVVELGPEPDLVVFLALFVGSLIDGFLVDPILFEVEVAAVVLDVVRVVVFTFGRHLVGLRTRPAWGLRVEEPLQFLEESLDPERLALIKLTRRQDRNRKARSGLRSLIFSVQ